MENHSIGTLVLEGQDSIDFVSIFVQMKEQNIILNLVLIHMEEKLQD